MAEMDYFGFVNLDAGGNPNCVQVVGQWAYIGTSGAFVVVDISDVTSPSEEYSFIESNTTDSISDLQIVGNYAYICSEDYFSILEISDLENISKVGQISGAANNLDNISGIRVSGNYAYLSVYTSDSLTIIDISDPENPSVAGNDTTNMNGPTCIELDGDYAYVACALNYRVVAFDISDPENPSYVSHVSNITPLRATKNVAKNGNYLYITNTADGSGWGGIAVIDISTAGYPSYHSKISGKANFFFTPTDIYIYGDYAYVCNNSQDDNQMGVTVYNISNITPTYVTRYTLTDYDARGIFVLNSYIYATYNSPVDSIYIWQSYIPAPTNVVATRGFEKITITFDAEPNADSYKLYYKDSAGVTKSDSSISNISSGYEFVPDDFFSEWYMCVCAVIDSLEGFLSSEVSALVVTNTQPQSTTVTDIFGIGPCNIVYNDNYLGATSGGITVEVKHERYAQLIDAYGSTPINIYELAVNIIVRMILKEETTNKLLGLLKFGTLDNNKITFGRYVGREQDGHRLILLPFDDSAPDLVIYKAVPIINWNITHSSEGERGYETKFKGLVDESRDDNDRLFRLDESYSI